MKTITLIVYATVVPYLFLAFTFTYAQTDMEMYLLNTDTYILTGNYEITGIVKNTGIETVSSFTVNWQVDNNVIQKQNFSNLNIISSNKYNFIHKIPWYAEQGTHILKVWVSNPNGLEVDNVPSNDTLSALMSVAYTQVKKKMLIEHFSSANCSICSYLNVSFFELMQTNADKLIPVSYQAPFFDSPMYQQNPLDVDARVELYNIMGVPNAVLNGNEYKAPVAYYEQEVIDIKYKEEAYIKILVNETLQGDSLANINVSIEPTADLFSDNLVAFICIVEDPVHYDVAPGGNGETDFPYMMRKFLPDNQGIALTSNLLGDVTNISTSYTFPDYVNPAKLRTLVFVQDTADLSIYQALSCAYGHGL